MSKPALGRGLGALLGGAPKASLAPTPARTVPGGDGSVPMSGSTPAKPDNAGGDIRRVAIDQVRPCPFQPRKDFGAEALRELADSIREQGLVQPLLVRPQGDGFELIAGERRWRAARLAGLAEVPILVRTASDREVLELALIENLQRENLNPIEEALGYSQLGEQFTLTQEEIARKVGRSRTVIANALRLLKLPASTQEALRTGRLSVGHAKVLLGLSDPMRQTEAAERVLSDGLSVRATEELVARWSAAPAAEVRAGAKEPNRPPATRDPHVVDVESRLRERLGTKVNLRYLKGRGAIEIRYFSDDEFERLLTLLGVSVD